MSKISFEYNPVPVISAALKISGLFSIDKLCIAMDIDPAIMSKLRHKKIPLNHNHLLKFHEFTGISVRELRNMMGDMSEGMYEKPFGKPLRWGR